jgi:hypothetical protein
LRILTIPPVEGVAEAVAWVVEVEGEVVGEEWVEVAGEEWVEAGEWVVVEEWVVVALQV